MKMFSADYVCKLLRKNSNIMIHIPFNFLLCRNICGRCKTNVEKIIMKPEMTDKNVIQTVRVYRCAYSLFLMLVLYQLLRGDIENATINMGIALIFDPFDPRVQWQYRPTYQRIWLIVHLTLAFAGFAYLIVR